MIRMSATQCDFDAKYRWCGNAGTQVAIRRIAADDRPQSLRDSSPGPASGDGLRPRASRIALAYKQLPGIVRRFQQQVPCSIGATRRNVDNSRAFDHIGRFSPSAVHRCAMLGMPGRGDVPATDDGMGERLMLNDDLDGQRGAWHHPQVRYDRHAIRRRQFALRRRERCKRTMIRLCCMSVAVMFAAMMNWALLRVPSASAGEEVFTAVTLCAGRQAACRTVWLWPVGQPAVIADFDPPDRPWLSGHRGVDLQASDGDELYAPADGIISFAGSVGGKSVVSVNHGDLVSTFEPAHTEGVAGTAVRRGDVIGEVGGASDHCDGRCLHWGVRRVRLQNEGTATTYLDPLARVRPMRIGLKPD